MLLFKNVGTALLTLSTAIFLMAHLPKAAGAFDVDWAYAQLEILEEKSNRQRYTGGISNTANPTSWLDNAKNSLSTKRTLKVGNVAELERALSSLAHTGGTILLSANQYGDLLIKRFSASSPVFIQSESSPAEFSGIMINRSSNLVFDNIRIARSLKSGEPLHFRILNVAMSERIALINSEVHGSIDGNFNNDGIGSSFRTSSKLVISNNTFHNLHRGAVFNKSDTISVHRNVFYDMRSEGVNFAGVENVTITSNYFTAFTPNYEAGDHADCIQFWTRGATGSRNVDIANNIMIFPEEPVQGIFVGNHIEGNVYRNFTIKGNVYYGNSSHGISVSDPRNVTITGNTVLAAPGAQRVTGINIHRTSGQVIINANISTNFAGKEMAETFTKNVLLMTKNPIAKNYIETVLVNWRATEDVSLPDLSVRPAEQIIPQIGAIPYDLQELIVLADQSHMDRDSLSVDFSWSGPFSNPEEFLFEWDLGDGTQITGERHTHSYKNPGDYLVSLTIRDQLGNLAQKGTKNIRLNSPLLLDISFDESFNNSSSYSVDIIPIEEAGITLVDRGNGTKAAKFSNAPPSIFQIEGGAHLHGMRELGISFDIKIDTSSTTDRQRPVWLVGSYGFEIDARKNLKVLLWTNKKQPTTLKASSSLVADGQWHSISLSYSSKEGKALLLVDEKIVDRKSGLAGEVASTGQKLHLGGSPWGHPFKGYLDNILIQTDNRF